jgi:hypothetical protein
MERAVVEGDAVLGLLGFCDELDNRPGQPNGSIRDAVQLVGWRRGQAGPGTKPSARRLGQASQAQEGMSRLQPVTG